VLTYQMKTLNLHQTSQIYKVKFKSKILKLNKLKQILRGLMQTLMRLRALFKDLRMLMKICKSKLMTLLMIGKVKPEHQKLVEVTRQCLAAGIEAYLTWAMERMFLACRDAGSDALGIGKAAVKEFDNPAAWESFDWESAYRRTEAEFTFLVAMA